MSREDSYGYDPMQSKAYDSNVHFGMPLDGKALLKDYQRDYGPTNLRTYSIQCGLQRIDVAAPPIATTQLESREETQVTDNLSTTLMLTITALIQLARTRALKKNCEPMNKRAQNLL
jgi:hypothetical protein